MNRRLQETCRDENLRIVSSGLAKLTWGNYSLIDERREYVHIKPSGVNLASTTWSDMSIVSLATGKLIDGKKQSVDTDVHLSLYRNFPSIRSICHTHSTYATAYAQANECIQILGTTHADTFKHDIAIREIPLSIYLDVKMHETLLGQSLVESMTSEDIDNCAVLLASHGPIVWATDHSAVDVAIVLEEVAKLSFLTRSINPHRGRINQIVSDFHWCRKHGNDARYGQNGH